MHRPHKLPRSCSALIGIALLITPVASQADALDNWRTNQVSLFSAQYGSLFNSVAYGNGRYVAVGQNSDSDTGIIASSEDGGNWAARSQPDGSVLDLYDVFYKNGTFVAVGWDQFTGHNIYTSPDGVVWTSHTTAIGNIFAVAFGNGVFVAVGDGIPVGSSSFERTNRNIYASSSGSTWTSRSTGLPSDYVRDILDVAFGAGTFVAVDSGGYFYTSSTGSSWTIASSGNPAYNGPAYVSYCNGRFYALAAGTNVVSADGFFWLPMTKNVTNVLTRFVYQNGIYAAISSPYENSIYWGGSSPSQLFTSTNGTNWVERQRGPAGQFTLSNLAFGPRNLMLVGFSRAGLYQPLVFLSDPLVSLAVSSGRPPALTLSGVMGASYRIDCVDNWSSNSNSWQTLTTFTLTNSAVTWIDTNTLVNQRFYHAVLLP